MPCFAFFHPFQLVTFSVSSTTFDIPVPKSHTHTTATPPERYSSFDRYIYFCVLLCTSVLLQRKSEIVGRTCAFVRCRSRVRSGHARHHTTHRSLLTSPRHHLLYILQNPAQRNQKAIRNVEPRLLRPATSVPASEVCFSPPGCDVFSSHMLVFFFKEGIERADTCFDGYSYGGGYPPQGYPPQGYPPQQGYGGAPPVCF